MLQNALVDMPDQLNWLWNSPPSPTLRASHVGPQSLSLATQESCDFVLVSATSVFVTVLSVLVVDFTYLHPLQHGNK